jgi:hypothetical protein
MGRALHWAAIVMPDRGSLFAPGQVNAANDLGATPLWTAA